MSGGEGDNLFDLGKEIAGSISSSSHSTGFSDRLFLRHATKCLKKLSCPEYALIATSGYSLWEIEAPSPLIL